jgi:hypothetical protein
MARLDINTPEHSCLDSFNHNFSFKADSISKRRLLKFLLALKRKESSNNWRWNLLDWVVLSLTLEFFLDLEKILRLILHVAIILNHAFQCRIDFDSNRNHHESLCQ